MKAAEEMLPDPGEGELGLADVENHRVVPEQVQIQVPPVGRAAVDQQETLEREGDMLFFHWEGLMPWRSHASSLFRTRLHIPAALVPQHFMLLRGDDFFLKVGDGENPFRSQGDALLSQQPLANGGQVLLADSPHAEVILGVESRKRVEDHCGRGGLPARKELIPVGITA